MAALEHGVGRVLISEEEIKARISAMGQRLTAEYAGKRLLLVSVLKGAFVFMADLMREIKLPCEIDFMCVSSYRDGTDSTGTVEVVKDLAMDVREYDVLIVEDILDSGRTLSAVRKLLEGREPRSLAVCTLLDKPARRVVPVECEYTCFEIPDEFAVGYGLDYAEMYRNLPYIGIYVPDSN